MVRWFLIVLIVFMQISYVSALSATVHIPEKYSVVHGGERLYFEVSLKYPENRERKDLKFDYNILQDGKIIAQARALKAIETQMSFIDYILIPESAKSGLSIIRVKISDKVTASKEESIHQVIETSFYVSRGGASSLKLYFFIMAGVALLVGFLVGVDVMIHRDKIFGRRHRRR